MAGAAVNLQTGVVVSLLVTLVGGVLLYNPQYYAWVGDQTGYAPVQPIDFSHKVHAKDNAIPCEYCHSGARKGAVAGVPPANVCLNCHTQVLPNRPEVKKIHAAAQSGKPIEWVRIHRVPDFVRFDHSAHVSKGVECQACHGPVQEMARVEQSAHLSMGWCVGCHRQYAKQPPEGVGKVNPPTECSTCHY